MKTDTKKARMRKVIQLYHRYTKYTNQMKTPSHMAQTSFKIMKCEGRSHPHNTSLFNAFEQRADVY